MSILFSNGKVVLTAPRASNIDAEIFAASLPSGGNFNVSDTIEWLLGSVLGQIGIPVELAGCWFIYAEFG